MKINRHVILLVAAVVILAGVLTACTLAGVAQLQGKVNNDKTETDVLENADTKGINMENGASYSFGSVVQMKKTVPAENKASVLLKGYYYPNDGGGGIFYWDADSVAAPDGGLVIAPNDSETGRYIRVCENDYRNVKWFGAVGSGSSNDTAAIKRAVESLPETGGTLCFPGGTYCITETINIGNGDGNSVRSDYNGIKLVGNGGGFGVYGGKEPTVIRATRALEAMISVNGRISNVTIEGIGLNADSLAKKCISAKAVNAMTVNRVVCKMFTECGIYLIGGTGSGNENKDCRFESVSSISTTDGIKCVYIDGNSETCRTENCMFIDCRFDIHTTNSSESCHITNASGLSFYRCHFAGYNEASDYLVLDAEVDGVPESNCFYDCSVNRIKVIENNGHSIGHNFFYGYGTYDGETPPDHPMLHGITDSGLPFRLGGE